MASLSQSPELYRPIPVEADPYSLDALRYDEPHYDAVRNKWIYITPELIQNFVDQINSLDTTHGQRFAIIIGAGGTPTMTPTGPGNSLEPTFNTQQLLSKTDPKLRDEFKIATFDAFATDSSALDIEDAGDLAIAMHYIWQEMKPGLHSQFIGFGVIHGTDTKDESSNHVAMMLGRHQPFNMVHGGTEKSTKENKWELWHTLREMVYSLDMLYENRLADNLTVMQRRGLLTAGLVYGPDGMDTPLHEQILDFKRLKDRTAQPLPNWLRKNYMEWSGTDPLVVYRGDNRIGILEARMAENRIFVENMIRDVGFVAIILKTHHSGTFDPQIMQQMSNLIEREQHEIPLFAINPVPTNAKPRVDVYAASAPRMLSMNVQPLDMTIEAAQAKLMRLLSEPGRDNPHHPNFMPADYDESKSTYRRHESWPDRLRRIRAAMISNYLGEIPNDQNRRLRASK